MAASEIISFGPYRLIPAERLLLKEGEVVDVGNRALDILVALAEIAGEVVSQSELIARAWPNVVVGEGSLRVTIAGLRKTLGDGQDGVRYISNVTGRGYCLVAQIERSTRPPTTSTLLQRRRHVKLRETQQCRYGRFLGGDGRDRFPFRHRPQTMKVG